MFTTFFYCITLLCICILAHEGAKRNRWKYFLTIVIILSLMAGLRAYSVGIDTANYVRDFELIMSGTIRYVYGLEKSFMLICRIILFICGNASFALFVFALITNMLIIYRMWELRDIMDTSIAILLYYTVFYFYSFNIVRQMCAVAIVFFATRYLRKQQYFRYVLLVLLATLFHTSAIIGFLAFGVELRFWKSLSKKNKIILVLGIGILPILVPVSFFIMSRYEHLLVNKETNIGIMMIIKFVLIIISIFTASSHYFSDEKRDLAYVNNVVNIRIFYMMGVILTSLGYLYMFVGRIGLYFYIFETVYWAILSKNGKYRQIWHAMAFIMGVYYLIVGVLGGGQGQVPYTFIWDMR